jgi:gluconate 2-dehydrogenase gamma chain
MARIERGPGNVEQQQIALGSGRLTRSALLKHGAIGAAGVTASGLLAGEARPAEAFVAPPPPLRFLTPWEYRYVTALAETIWPSDDLGPGARSAGVGYYIDGQLSGFWGQGHRFYLNGPFFTPADTGHGWQVPLTPAEIYRTFLPGFDEYVRGAYGASYLDLAPDKQVLAMEELRLGTAVVPLGGSTVFSSSDFFSLFRQNVLEGMFADPAYGGNREMVGWKWIGFPGDPMRRGDIYYQYIFSNKRYPFAGKPLPLMNAPTGAATTGKAVS